MLRIEALHVHYGLSHVIQGLDLEAAPGEVVGIFGRNGVGKTTLLKTVAGWVKPSGGSVRFGDATLTGLEPDAVARSGIGFVPEDRRIFPGLTVEQNLDLGLLQRPGRGRAAGKQAVASVFDRFPRLAERRKQLGTTLSGGEQQMLAMARAMVGEPALLLVDEPTEGLAPMIVESIFAIIREAKAAGTIVLLVEQNVHGALAVADRFYAIERGRIVLAGDAGREADRAALLEAITV